MKHVAYFSSVLVGLVFIFSGFVKGVDPLGTAFRIEDYLIAFGFDWLTPAALFLSVALCTFEFALGIFLVLRVYPVWSSWALLLLMSFFTILTLNDAINKPVADCGCFGDAIKLTHLQTFLKNVVLMFPTIIIFIHRKKIAPWFGRQAQLAAMLSVPLIFAAFSVYNYRNLPTIDFLQWKVGQQMMPPREFPVEFYLTYQNVVTGEVKEFLSPHFPFDDPDWLREWNFVSQRVVDPNPPPPHGLAIFDRYLNNFTEHFIANPEFQFLLIVWDAETADFEALKAMNSFFKQTEAEGHSFVAITASSADVDFLQQKVSPYYELYIADDVELKMMVRSNPGLILMKDGVVLEKWSHHRFPDYEEVAAKFLRTDAEAALPVN